MSTADEWFPIQAQERPLRFESDVTDAAVLVHQELRRLSRRQRDETDRLLKALAVAAFQVEQAAKDLTTNPDAAGSVVDALHIIAANVKELLDQRRVRVDDLTGRPWTGEARAAVDVRGYTVRDDLSEPRVAHMEFPVIYRGERLLLKGAASIEGPKRD